jgi:hypothetical protein
MIRADRHAGIRSLRSFVSDEQHMALPRLYGGPAYSRPPRPVQEIVRPFDPDELPLEAERIDDDAAGAEHLMGIAWGPASAPPSKPKGSRRGRAAKPGKGGGPATGTAKQVGAGSAGPSKANREGALQGRPFRLRSMGRIFGADRK